MHLKASLPCDIPSLELGIFGETIKFLSYADKHGSLRDAVAVMVVPHYETLGVTNEEAWERVLNDLTTVVAHLRYAACKLLVTAFHQLVEENEGRVISTWNPDENEDLPPFESIRFTFISPEEPEADAGEFLSI